VFFEQVIREISISDGRAGAIDLQSPALAAGPPAVSHARRHEDVTPSLHAYYRQTHIKQYHKENRALRTETTINNTYDFGIANACTIFRRCRRRICGQSTAA